MRSGIPGLLMLLAATQAGAAPAAHKAVVAKKAAVKKTPAKPVQADASPATKAVAVEVRTQVGGKLKGFYAARGFWPLWVHAGKIGPEAGALLDDLASADLDGLNPKRYDVPALHKLVDEADGPASVAHAELALSQALADYVRDVRRAPDTEIRYLDAELEPTKLKPDTVLRGAALAPTFATYVTTMGWMDPLYVKLRSALAKAGDGPDAKRIRLNLERTRILPSPFVRHIVVDAASARLWYYEGGKLAGTMRVVVGTPETQTPMLAGVVRYAILNPYWNVPADLIAKKVAPKMLAGGTLKGLRYEALADWSANPAPLDPKAIDWHAVAAGSQEVRIRQLPGGANAMGKVKFMFPNDQGIYLHDTPLKALMKKTDRHLSNGCVRLEDAPRLGQWLLGTPIAGAAKSKDPEQDVPLARPVPVYLTYLTAQPGDTGATLLPDVYGRDGALQD